jgi:hypothetical protein
MNENDIQWQTQHFAQLKSMYQVGDYEEVLPSSHLYLVLKQIDANKPLKVSDINFLIKRKLTKTLVCAIDKYAKSLESKVKSGQTLSLTEIDWLKQNERENILQVNQKQHFAKLKSKYGVSDYQDKSPSSQLYAILQKLAQGKRLEPTEVAWLEETHHFYSSRRRLFSGQILLAYHRIEAIFYERAYKRTGHKWHLPSASSHWRRAGKPQKALELTDEIDFEQIKENRLKSALLTTRGGAFRDLSRLDDAETCARCAIKYQPNSHHPYTLMGAICYERGQYSEGDKWFQKAIQRGASPRDQDAEIKRIVKKANREQRQEVIEYLLKKDPVRYSWAKSMLKKDK